MSLKNQGLPVNGGLGASVALLWADSALDQPAQVLISAFLRSAVNAFWFLCYDETCQAVRDTPMPTADETTRLIEAGKRGDVAEVERLLDAGVPVDAKAGRDSPLLAAVGAKRLDIVELLVERGAEVDGPDGAETPLLRLAWNPSIEIARFLIERGARLDALDSAGGGVVCRAAQYGSAEFVAFLSAQGMDLNVCPHVEPKSAPLLHALEGKNFEVVRYLVEVAGVDLDVSDSSSQCAVYYAANRADDASFVDLLARAGANLEAKTAGSRYSAGGFTPLIEAARLGKDDVVRVLLEHGAVVDAVDDKRSTALHHGITYPGVVEALIGAGADPKALNEYEQTPWELASDEIRALLGTLADADETQVSDIDVQALMAGALPLLEEFAAQHTDTRFCALAVEDRLVSLCSTAAMVKGAAPRHTGDWDYQGVIDMGLLGEVGEAFAELHEAHELLPQARQAKSPYRQAAQALLDGLIAADAFGGLQRTDDFWAALVEHVY